jgi:hypothetical protein
MSKQLPSTETELDQFSESGAQVVSLELTFVEPTWHVTDLFRVNGDLPGEGPFQATLKLIAIMRMVNKETT